MSRLRAAHPKGLDFTLCRRHYAIGKG